MEAEPEVIDGRHARRERNRVAVLDAVLELFDTNTLIPSVEEVAKRSGLSLRSVYRYYEDLSALLHAAIERSMERSVPLVHIEDIGEGPLEHRVAALVDARLRLYEAIKSSYRATLHHAAHNEPMTAALVAGRERRFAQVRRQFAPELETLGEPERTRVARAADLIIQFEAIEQLRLHAGLSREDTAAVMRTGLMAIFGSV